MCSFKRKTLRFLASVSEGSAQECLLAVANIWPAGAVRGKHLKSGKKWAHLSFPYPHSCGGGKKSLYLTHTTLDFVCVCADNSSACVCEEWTAEQRVQVDCCLLWTWRFLFTQSCEKYSTTLFNLSGDLLNQHATALLTKCFTLKSCPV